MAFSELGQLVADVGARHSLLGLDICHAGGYLTKKGTLGDVAIGGFSREYLQALMTAVPSARVLCSVGADRLAGEGVGVENGHMTAAFLEAASRLRGNSAGLLMDAPIVNGVRLISRTRWNQEPKVGGITADFPVLYAQRELVGDVAVIGTNVVGASYKVDAYVCGRRGVPTRFAATVANLQGRVLARREHRFVPHADEEYVTVRFDVAPDDIALDPASIAHHVTRGTVPLTWRVALEDLRGRQFDECFSIVHLATRRVA